MRIENSAKASIVAVAALAGVLALPAVSAAKLMHFMTVINGSQETPPNQSIGIGNGILTYDTATKTLCYYVSFIGITEVAAHIHGPAAPGVPGPIIITLPAGTGKQGCVVNPPAPFVVKDLQKNLYYVNIHTAGLPAGEIRGQILRIK
jgi:hypothetical protein